MTLLIHGTFAAEDTWWRLGDGSTFADRLETELSASGMVGTVWKPVLDAPRLSDSRGQYTYEDFSWSGENRHKDRIAGARKLGTRLNEIADSLQATPDRPLFLNLVAHSHGGNVALECLRVLNSSIKVRKLILLGTPLIVFRPAFRLAQPLVAALLTLLITAGIGGFLGIGILNLYYLLSGQPINRGDLFSAVLFPIVLPLYSWIFYATTCLIDALWKFVLTPALVVMGKNTRETYGPSVQVMKKWGRRRITAFISDYDEAGLLLRIGSAPRIIYEDFIANKYSGSLRILERIFVRPLALQVPISTLEILLERVVLGFPWSRLLFVDYDLANLRPGGDYPPGIVKHINVTKQLQPVFESNALDMSVEVARAVSPGPISVTQQVREVTQTIIHQIKLRHAAYRTNPEIINQIVTELTREVPATSQDQKRSYTETQTFKRRLSRLAAHKRRIYLKWGVSSIVGFIAGLLILGLVVGTTEPLWDKQGVVQVIVMTMAWTLALAGGWYTGRKVFGRFDRNYSISKADDARKLTGLSLLRIKQIVKPIAIMLLLVSLSIFAYRAYQAKPEWTTQGGSYDRKAKTFFGVGSVVGIKNEHLGWYTAENRARAELGRVLVTYMTLLAERSDRLQNNRTGEADDIPSQINKLAWSCLHGTRPVDRYRDSRTGAFYVRIRIDTKDILYGIEKANDVPATFRNFIRLNVESDFR